MKIPKEDVVLLIALLPNEHQDLYRLVNDMEVLLGISVVRIHDPKNRTPMDVFHDVKFLGNSRIDPCSKILKRDLLRGYIKDNFDPQDTTLYVGIGAHEIDRHLAIRKRWLSDGYKVDFPLLDTKLTKKAAEDICKRLVGYIPELYIKGFAHNNCGGACVKAGKGQWAKLLCFYPEVYKEWEDGEELFRQEVGDYTILKETVGGEVRQLSLKEFRERLHSQWGPLFPHEYIDDEEDTGCKFCDGGL